MNFLSYAQSLVTVVYDGVPLIDMGEGASVDITVDGGMVEKTEGTDGASISVGHSQGATVKVRLKETSPVHEALQGFNLAQQYGSPGGVLVIMSGTLVLHTLINAYVSAPGALSTGDKKMGAIEYTFMSTKYAKGP